MVKYATVTNPIRCWLLVVSIVLVCTTTALAETQLSIESFLGPPPGTIFYYESIHGEKMTLRGLIQDKDGDTLIEHIHFFPYDHNPPDYCTNQLTEIYGLTIREDRLMKKVLPLNGDIGYEVKLDLKSPVWGNPFTLMKPGSRNVKDGRKMVSKCRIIKLADRHLFGKRRSVIKVVGDYCPSQTYAAGIGMIEFLGMKLVQIEKFGEEMSDY